MYKKFSSRTTALVRSCLPKSSEDEVDDETRVSDTSIIENSPQNSPADMGMIVKSTIRAQCRPLSFAEANHPNVKELENVLHEVTEEKSAEQLITGVECFDDANANSNENIGEKSIEPPPYSPLTPRPLSNFNARMHEKCMNSNSTIMNVKFPESEKSIAIPTSSPLIIKPYNDTLVDPFSSPLRPMSPETTNLFNILTEDLQNGSESPENIFETDENRPNFSKSTEIMYNSDDSVRDPDFIANDNNIDGSDTSCSELSESLISSIPELPDMPATSEARSSQGRPKKGRKRKYGEHTREERKKRKYKNLSYVNSKKQNINPKPFIDFNCKCPKSCKDNISSDNRLIEFQKFYDLGSYEAQNMFIAACVKEMPVKRSYVSTTTDKSKKKTFTREYHLKDVVVCKNMFINTLQISSKRVNTSLCKKRGDCIKDLRGRQGGHNKASSESEAFIINIINKLPTYISHYRRANCNDAKFLRPDMTVIKIYELYCNEAKSAGQKVLSFSKVKSVFLTKFNLRTKPLKKDTCNKCDYYCSKKITGSEEEKALLEISHNEHLQKAKILQNQMKADLKLAQQDPSTETITFDLQKTLPLPRIPTNIVFYKRQLWVYNLGIHVGSNDQAHCNVWVEGEAGRGSQEVGSCLIKHLTERLGDRNVKNLILWSDSCGGQNRNIKLTMMLKALLYGHSTLQTIRLCFLESGHSFLPNDTDFGRIECALKLQQRLYTPDDYIRVMHTCKKNKPMQVHRMKKEDFLSSANLEKKITNRKKGTDGSKVSWLNTKEIMMKKEVPFSIFMRPNLNDDYIEVNLKKKIRGDAIPLSTDIMDQLWPNGKPIPEAKLNDLKSLLHLIPVCDQEFYKNLTGDVTVEDDVDGFSGEPDFEIEVHDEDKDNEYNG